MYKSVAPAAAAAVGLFLDSLQLDSDVVEQGLQGVEDHVVPVVYGRTLVECATFILHQGARDVR